MLGEKLLRTADKTGSKVEKHHSCPLASEYSPPKVINEYNLTIF